MSKINLETIKKLLSVKKGGAEFFRLVVKITLWLFVIGAIISVIYSLDEIQKSSKTRTDIAIAKTQMEIAKVQRQCDATVRNSLAIALEKAKKEKKEIKEDDKKKFLNDSFAQCLFLNGIDIPVNKEVKTEKIEKK